MEFTTEFIGQVEYYDPFLSTYNFNDALMSSGSFSNYSGDLPAVPTESVSEVPRALVAESTQVVVNSFASAPASESSEKKQTSRKRKRNEDPSTPVKEKKVKSVESPLSVKSSHIDDILVKVNQNSQPIDFENFDIALIEAALATQIQALKACDEPQSPSGYATRMPAKRRGRGYFYAAFQEQQAKDDKIAREKRAIELTEMIVEQLKMLPEIELPEIDQTEQHPETSPDEEFLNSIEEFMKQK